MSTDLNANTSAAFNLQQLKRDLTSRPVLIVLVIVLLFLARDFFSRVYTPVSAPEAAELQAEDTQWFDERTDQDLPEYLAQWLAPTEDSESDGQTEQDASESRQTEALAGSEELGSFRLRVRAIFINRLASGREQAFAIAEKQDVETGEVSRVVLHQGETIEQHRVARVQANSVVIALHTGEDREGHEGAEEITLYVFNHRERAQDIPAELIESQEQI